MKKLLDSDWLRAVQFKCNTSANYTSQFWIDWLKENKQFSMLRISRKMITEILCGTFEKKFFQMRKNDFKCEDFPAPPCKFFHVYIINK